MEGLLASRQYRRLAILGVSVAFCLYVVLKQPVDHRALYDQYYQRYLGYKEQEDFQAVPNSILSDGQFNPTLYVRGAPAKTFRENLRKDIQYITTWNYGGSTNNLMAMTHLLLLALLTRRVAIIPPLISEPRHLGGDTTALNFGSVYDIPRLAKALQMPIIEWSHVKNWTDPTSAKEDLGCWSAYAPFTDQHQPATAPTPHVFKLAVSYTPVPPFAKLYEPHINDQHVTFQGLSTILFPPGRREALSRPEAAKKSTFNKELEGKQIDPDDHMACFDTLYYMGSKESFEWEWPKRYSVAWNLVATNIHFHPYLEQLAEEALRDILLDGGSGKIPPYIAIHVRRTDFADYCNKKYSLRECLNQVPDFAKAVDEIKSELKKQHGASHPLGNIRHVVMTSDEKDPIFWEEVRAVGWKYVDYASHEPTEYGKWYPTLIDTVIQSNAAGFVGTDGSTMSLIAGRRVHDWRGGPHRFLVNNYHYE